MSSYEFLKGKINKKNRFRMKFCKEGYFGNIMCLETQLENILIRDCWVWLIARELPGLSVCREAVFCWLFTLLLGGESRSLWKIRDGWLLKENIWKFIPSYFRSDLRGFGFALVLNAKGSGLFVHIVSFVGEKEDFFLRNLQSQCF